MVAAYISRIGTAVPPFDAHWKFVDYAPRLLSGNAARQLFLRMAERGQIDHRYSFLQPSLDETGIDVEGFYQRGRFPDTSARMCFFERHAPMLAVQALNEIDFCSFKDDVTHLIVACCTGFYAPRLDIDIVNRFELRPTVERTIIGFMGCYSAITALKLARQIVRSDPHAKVIIVNIELGTIHLQEMFGSNATGIPVSSTKPIHGHALGAAGALELAITVSALRQGIAPPTINWREPDPSCGLDMAPNVARPIPIRVAMSNSFAFGGVNAALVVRKVG